MTLAVVKNKLSHTRKITSKSAGSLQSVQRTEYNGWFFMAKAQITKSPEAR